MEVILLLIVCISNIFCLTFGVMIGQKAARGETVRIPKPDPIGAVNDLRERLDDDRARREAEREADRIGKIFENMDNFNGTPEGQKDID